VNIKTIILSLLAASTLPSLADDSSGYPSDWVKFAAEKCGLTYGGVSDKFGSKPFYYLYNPKLEIVVFVPGDVENFGQAAAAVQAGVASALSEKEFIKDKLKSEAQK
jgi:hypothetical protein